ncbi:uncharacterized protein [Apostichopus japonicus]|uniref:uncharacterized protein isoform X2 n=1 Tax=Stichopus japonicus TaxID=307972 RepID=UPI003AB314B2
MRLIFLLVITQQFYAAELVILKGTHTTTFPIGRDILLTCVNEDGGMIWTSSTGDILFNEELRYAKNEIYNNFELEDSGNLSSMIITNASLEDEGHYSCSDTISKATIQVKIEVAPRLSIAYDGFGNPGPTLPNTISHLIISCLAEGAKPSVSIRCKVGGSDWLRPKNNEILTRGSVFDTTVTLNFQFINDPNGTVVTCETSGQSSIKPITETQVLSTPTCNLHRNYVEVNCNCTANPPVFKYILSIDGQMVVGRTLKLEGLEASTVICFGVSYIGVGKSNKIVLDSKYGTLLPVLLIILACLAVVGFGSTGIACLLRISHNQAVSSQRKRNSSIKLRKQRNRDSTSNNEMCQSDKRTLDPNQANYYTREDVKKRRHLKMVAEKDITIILNLKMGKIYKRWVGSVDLPWRSNNCVVITTMADTARRTKDIQWEAFLRNSLELPKSNNLTTIEAISIQSDNMYLISEHLDCTTLHSMLTKNNYCSISLTVSDVIKHVTGVLEGVDVINKFGFLHPGLTTKKVLLTKEGQVKFYDFCLADDAPKIAELKKSDVTPVTVNQFPPETLSLNEYNVSSDVWSVAVVIWEIMAAGKLPFPDDKECYLDQMSDEPSFTWPQKYLQLKNTMLFDCWNRNPSHRPMIGSLKGSFLKIFRTVLTDSSYEITVPSTYMPMRASYKNKGIAEQVYQEVLTDSLYEAAVPSTYMPMRTSNAYKGIAEQILADISYEVSVSSTYMPMRTSKAYKETSEHVY